MDDRTTASSSSRDKGRATMKTDRGRPWMLWLAILAVLAGQVYLLPQRLEFWSELRRYAGAADRTAALRLAYEWADFDLLEWVGRQTPPRAVLLLVTSSPRADGGPVDFLFHRALYHLYPRVIWWAAPVAATRYPAWWMPTGLTEAALLARVQQVGADYVLAKGFSTPPLRGPAQSFDGDTWLISTGARR